MIDVKTIVLKTLENIKALDVCALEVSGMTTITDFMVIATGTSTRHVKSIANEVVLKAKKLGLPISIEGEKEGEWILLDLNDVILHVMIPKSREFYNLEKLWSNFDIKQKAIA